MIKRQFNLSINTPCSQKFENFQSTGIGGFCQSCSKEVIDFTKMSDSDILKYFNNQTNKTCGRLSISQLKTYTDYATSTPGSKVKWLGVGVMGLSLLFPIKNSIAQQSTPLSPIVISEDDPNETNAHDTKKANDGHIVKGIIVYEDDNEPLPGVNVVLKGTGIGTVSDIDGMFTFPNPLQIGDVLVFSFIGLQTEEFKIGRNAPAIIDLTMLSMYADIMGEVDIDEVYSSRQTLWDKVKTIFK